MLIGLCGKKGSGKSFFANYLINNFNFIELSFAQPLKEATKIIFNLSDDDVNNQNKKEIKIDRLNASPRELLQWLGTDIIREEFNKKFNYNGSIWVDNMKQNLIINKNKNIVVSDLRFENEAQLIKEFGGTIIFINGEFNNNNLFTTHKSETEMLKIKYDYKIDNKKELTDINFEFLNQLIETNK